MDNRVRLKIQNSLALHQRCQLASHLQNIFLVLLYYMPMWNRISHFLIWCGRLESCQLGRHSRAKLKCDWETNWHLYWNARKNLILRRTLNWIIQNIKLKTLFMLTGCQYEFAVFSPSNGLNTYSLFMFQNCSLGIALIKLSTDSSTGNFSTIRGPSYCGKTIFGRVSNFTFKGSGINIPYPDLKKIRKFMSKK